MKKAYLDARLYRKLRGKITAAEFAMLAAHSEASMTRTAPPDPREIRATLMDSLGKLREAVDLTEQLIRELDKDIFGV